MSVVLKEPNNARARPSSLIKRKLEYDRMFNETLPTEVYLWIARLLKKIDSLIKLEQNDLLRAEELSLGFHIAMAAVMKFLGKKDYSQKDLETNDFSNISDASIFSTMSEVVSLGKEFSKNNNWSLERVSKSKEFVEYLILNITLPSQTK